MSAPDSCPVRVLKARREAARCLSGSLFLAFGLLAGCSTDATGPGDRRIGPEGGTASLNEGAVTLLIPDGALSDAVWFTTLPTNIYPDSPLLVPGSIFEVGPPGTVFSRPVRLTLAYDPEEIPAGVGEGGLGVFRAMGDSWVLLEGTTTNPTANTVTGSTSSLGRFGVLGLSIVGMELAPAQDTVAPGVSRRLLASPKGEDGRTLTARPVSWTSSDTATARVDSTGLVTGVGEGTAIITAVSGSHSATATVVTRVPVASVDLSPSSGTLAPGQSIQLTGSARDAAGNALEGRILSWTSTDTEVATVSSTGLVQALALGSVTITASTEGKTGAATLSVHADLEILTASLATGVVGIPYSQALAASGGNGSFQWSIPSGSLPSGLSLNPSTGMIFGTPLNASVDTFTVRVNSSIQMAEKVLIVAVSPVPVASVTITPSTAELAVGDTISLLVTARDGSGNVLPNRAAVWATSNEGVATVSQDGFVVGQRVGSATIAATVEGFPAWAAISVWDPLEISDSTLVDGRESAPYSDTLSATGGDGNYAWSVVSDSLPTGITLDDSTGVVAGTPSEAGATSFTVLVESGDSQVDSVRVSITIREILTISTTALESGILGTAYEDRVVAVGGREPNSWSISAGALPSGLVIGAATGVISGTPTSSGTSTFTVEVESDDGQTDSQVLTLAVSQRPVAAVTLSPSPATVTQGQDLQLTATPKDASGATLTGRTVIWSTGNAGVATVNSSGLVSGTGVGTTTITATSEGIPGTAVITVHAVLAVTTGALAGGTTGSAYNQALAASGGDGTYTWTISAGALPAGLSLDGNTGIVSGVPAGAGISGFTVQVTSGDGQVATKDLSITIS